ncbi:hypothetical protein H920_15440 [Fukomys damarensis]|uniref:Uncharacterized protein n=1 Tax=Fukomys damarensis TaxID=885580 RepID=A0A091CZE6_FUKDA|nr:hypothetical protein H920_15440 [Fukomys damarensis]
MQSGEGAVVLMGTFLSLYACISHSGSASRGEEKSPAQQAVMVTDGTYVQLHNSLGMHGSVRMPINSVSIQMLSFSWESFSELVVIAEIWTPQGYTPLQRSTLDDPIARISLRHIAQKGVEATQEAAVGEGM